VIAQLELRRSHMLLAEEQLRSERLLHAILPVPVAERLKGGESPIADAFDDATVLFADLVGFTPRAARLSATATVELLSSVFADFDRLAARRGVEKIKTIGDAYLVVGGVPVPRPDHTEAVVEMALDMMETMARRSDGLSLRIGIHAGPVVAGVLGSARLSYDVWGDTVNTASRMESHGLPGAIQVSAAIEERLRGRYRFDERGALLVKGKGEMSTFLLAGRR
jgi:class 3 adenylate cyclase